MSKEKENIKLVPQLRFAEFENDGDWEVLQLGDKTSKVGSGKTPRGGNKNYKTEGLPFVRSQNIGWGILLLDDVVYIDEEIHKTFLGSEIKLNDVLLNITGASIGRSAIANHVIAGGNVNQHVCIIRVKKKELNPVFLNQFIISHICQNQIDSFQAGGNREGLNFSQIRSFKIPSPPRLSEQKKIAATLASLDNLIAAENEKLEALKVHKKGLLQQLFPTKGEKAPKLRFGEFSGAWEEKSLGEIAEIITGSTPKTSEPENYGGDKLFVSPADISTERYITKAGKTLSEVGFSKSRIIAPNSILFVCIGSTIGKVAQNKIVCATNQQINSLIPFDGYSNDFVYSILEKSSNFISSIKLFFPKTEKEQQKIADSLLSVDDLIDSQTYTIKVLQEHKKGLMQKMFPNPNTRKG